MIFADRDMIAKVKRLTTKQDPLCWRASLWFLPGNTWECACFLFTSVLIVVAVSSEFGVRLIYENFVLMAVNGLVILWLALATVRRERNRLKLQKQVQDFVKAMEDGFVYLVADEQQASKLLNRLKSKDKSESSFEGRCPPEIIWLPSCVAMVGVCAGLVPFISIQPSYVLPLMMLTVPIARTLLRLFSLVVREQVTVTPGFVLLWRKYPWASGMVLIRKLKTIGNACLLRADLGEVGFVSLNNDNEQVDIPKLPFCVSILNVYSGIIAAFCSQPRMP